MSSPIKIPEIVVLASGNGTTFEAIAKSAKEGKIKARIARLICNKKNAPVLDRAKKLDVSIRLIDSSDDKLFSEIFEELEELDPDLIVLAGFMRILPDYVIAKFGNRMINTHPALLPCFGGKGFYGDRVHRAVLESGVKVTGCSVHFVSTDVDGGPIIAQECVPILEDDDISTLKERVHSHEKKLLIRTIDLLLTTPYEITGKRVVFKY